MSWCIQFGVNGCSEGIAAFVSTADGSLPGWAMCGCHGFIFAANEVIEELSGLLSGEELPYVELYLVPTVSELSMYSYTSCTYEYVP